MREIDARGGTAVLGRGFKQRLQVVEVVCNIYSNAQEGIMCNVYSNPQEGIVCNIYSNVQEVGYARIAYIINYGVEPQNVQGTR